MVTLVSSSDKHNSSFKQKNPILSNVSSLGMQGMLPAQTAHREQFGQVACPNCSHVNSLGRLQVFCLPKLFTREQFGQ